MDRKIVVFGGFQDNTQRFNDVWVLDSHTLKWSQPIKLRSESEIAPSAQLASKLSPTPLPRGEHAACQIGTIVYVFGGYGGPDWARRDFNDLYALDTETWSWTCLSVGTTVFGAPKRRSMDDPMDDEDEEEVFPDARAGHSLSRLGDSKLVLFGGWNSREQFSDVWIFTLENNRWEELEIENPLSEPRWSHAAMVAESIPHDQLYVFGGSSGDNKKMSLVPLLQMCGCSILSTVDGQRLTLVTPRARADTSGVYSKSNRTLYLFGGWANKWFKDAWKLDCGAYVGPPTTSNLLNQVQELLLEAQTLWSQALALRILEV